MAVYCDYNIIRNGPVSITVNLGDGLRTLDDTDPIPSITKRARNGCRTMIYKRKEGSSTEMFPSVDSFYGDQTNAWIEEQITAEQAANIPKLLQPHWAKVEWVSFMRF